MKILITGITGFAGSFLAEHLLELGHDVSGTYLSDDSLVNVESIKDKITVEKVNLLEEEKVENYIKKIHPDGIIHLAALTSPAQSFQNPKEFFHNNIDSEITILEAVRKNSIVCRILVISSSEMYGLVRKEDIPIDEDTLLFPSSPYAVSKIAQDYLAYQYYRSYDMNILRIRPFNHIGPRQSPHFVVSSFAKQIAELEKKEGEKKLTVGNLSAFRDFTDVRDMVKAYALLFEKGKAGEIYNIGRGQSYQISDILNKLLSLAATEIEWEQDPKLLRPSDIPNIVCDNRKVRNLTGWEPKIPIEQSLKDTLDYWRNIVYNN